MDTGYYKQIYTANVSFVRVHNIHTKRYKHCTSIDFQIPQNTLKFKRTQFVFTPRISEVYISGNLLPIFSFGSED